MELDELDQVGEGSYETDLTEDDLYELQQGDSVTDEYVPDAVGDNGVYLAAVEEGSVYQVPGNFNEWHVAQALGEEVENVEKDFVSYNENAKTSTSSPRVNEQQFEELTADAAVSILNGRVQEKQGQSTDAVQERDPIDVIR